MKNVSKLFLLGAVVFMLGVVGCKKADITPEKSSLPPSTTLKTVHFDLDRSDIRSVDQKLLQQNVQYLKENPSVKVVVEGYCDNRGSIAYNKALGKRRAESVKSYYINRGINANRITTISYGLEKPVDTKNNEDAWAKNRRSETKDRAVTRIAR